MMKKLLLAGILLGMSFSVFAVPITGGVGITGVILLPDPIPAVILGVDFDGNGSVMVGTGDLASLVGSAATLTDIVFTTPGEIWEVGSFSYVASSFSNIAYSSPLGGISFTSTGTLMGPGFDDTQSILTFSSNSVGGVVATFSSSAAAVPEPTTLALLGIGLIGFGARALRRKAS